MAKSQSSSSSKSSSKAAGPIQLLYDGNMLTLSIGDTKLSYFANFMVPYDSVPEGIYQTKLNQFFVKSWLNPKSYEQQEILYFAITPLFVPSLDNDKKIDLYLVGSQFGLIPGCYLLSPFSELIGRLQSEAISHGQEEIIMVINFVAAGSDASNPSLGSDASDLSLDRLETFSHKVRVLPTKEQKQYPPPVPDELIEEIRKRGEEFGINSNLRLAHFLAQVAAESGFKPINENLYYTTPERLVEVFGNKKKDSGKKKKDSGNKKKDSGNKKKDSPFETVEKAKQFLSRYPDKTKRQIAIAQAAYGPDGWLRRGRGLIQLTGDTSVAFADLHPDVKDNPELINTVYAFEAAGWYANTFAPGFWKGADKGDSDKAARDVTRSVNPGLFEQAKSGNPKRAKAALADINRRTKLFHQYYDILEGKLVIP